MSAQHVCTAFHKMTLGRCTLSPIREPFPAALPPPPATTSRQERKQPLDFSSCAYASPHLHIQNKSGPGSQLEHLIVLPHFKDAGEVPFILLSLPRKEHSKWELTVLDCRSSTEAMDFPGINILSSPLHQGASQPSPHWLERTHLNPIEEGKQADSGFNPEPGIWARRTRAPTGPKTRCMIWM